MPRLYSWALMTYLFPKRSITLFRTMRGKVCLVSLCFVSWLKHSFDIVGKSKPVLKLSRECSFGTSNVAKIRPSVQLGTLTIFISKKPLVFCISGNNNQRNVVMFGWKFSVRFPNWLIFALCDESIWFQL